MIVIVDGLDCSGKSTVYDRLYQNLDQAYFIKESYPGPSDMERIDRLTSFHRRVEEPYLYVYDRASVIDDPVYEYRFNQRNSILEDLLTERLFRDVLVLHFTVEKQEWLNRLSKRGDKYIDASEYESIVNAYNKFYAKFKPRVVTIDTTNLDPEGAYNKALEYIKDYLEEMKATKEEKYRGL